MTLRKLGIAVAFAAVSALVLLSVATGSTAAYAAPNPPAVDQLFPDPWITDSTQPPLQGNMDLGVVQIDVETSSDGVNYTPYCSVTTSPLATTWSCLTPTGTLTLGPNFIRAVATDAVPETSAPGTPITITVVNGPTITSPADDIYTNDYQPTFSGTSEGSYFDVYTSDFATLFCSGTVVNSAWNCTSGTIPDGDYTYLVQSAYGATTLYSPYRTLHIDTAPPAAPTINAMGGPVNSSPGASVSGAAEEFATIDLLVDGSSVPCNTGPIDYTGYWSCTLPDGLSAGAHTLTAFQTDRAGNVSALSAGEPLDINDNTPPAPPVVTSPIGSVFGGTNLVVTNDTTPTVFGTGEPGATLDVLGNTCMIVPTIVDGTGNWSCQLTTPMADGSHDVHFGQTDTALNSSPLTSPFVRFFVDTVPPSYFELWTPTGTTSGGVTTATTSNPHPFISGNGEGGARMYIYRNGSIPVPCEEGPLYSGEGGFGCTVAPALSPGVYNFGFTQIDSAGNSSGSPVVALRLTVLAPPVPPRPPTATFPTLLAWFLNFQASSSEVLPGQTISFTASDLPPGAVVTAELHSDPIFLGTTLVRPDGTFTLNSVIPYNAEPGDHHYVVTVTPIGGTAQTVEMPVRVVAAPRVPAPEPSTAPQSVLPPQNHADSGGGAAPRNEPASPNTLSKALSTVQQITANPMIIGAAAASALALLFLVALPAELLNSTIDEHYRRIFGRIPRFRITWLTRLRERLARAPIIGGLALTTLAALIFGFSDPHFGFDIASLRMLLAALISMFVLGYVANGITGGALKKLWRIPSVIELQPFGLVLAFLGVVLSRLLDFAPGLLIGLVLCLALSASATEKDEVRYVFLWTGTVLGLSIVGWVGYSLTSGLVAPTTFAGALLDDTLVAVATAGVSALVIGLLPVGYLDGRTLFLNSKLKWLFSYLVVLVAFFVIVVPSGALWGGIQGPFWIWLTVLLVFATVCVGVYLWFRTHPDGEEVVDVRDGESADEVAAQVHGRPSPLE